ncbi:MAG TPA: phenylalanine--tRNA ligase subunit beta [Solirubrobacteraceae bacterium]|nr:phenylalanine--tRNA ligase subunit beta [Solirubrobacteraceae bacterium]
MRAPLNWLREYCSPDLDTAAVADRLTMTGTKVEAIHRHGVGGLEHFVVARVLSADQHPQADRLSVCTVDAGDGQPRQIVCGAPNVAAGQTVAVAKPGAVMPDGTTLGKVKLRGVESDGMILAEDELAIGTEHAGILELQVDGAAPGTPLADVLDIATDVLELEITSNRPDCLAVYGVARELHAATGAPLSQPPWSGDPGTDGPVDGITVDVACQKDLCPRFTARVFDDVKIGPSPPWLKARLMAAGQRPISNVVDITNYVMLVTGQPLHAFDLDRVAGGQLVVRRARDGEQVQTLDGQTRTLDGEMVVIDDADGPTSIAGVMGGARSEVAGDTTRVLMEVATWDGPNIHRTALRLGLRSEASARFEKQLQPEQALEAQALAAKLMIDLCGARLRPGTIDVGGPGPDPISIRLRDRRVGGLLGIEIPRERQRQILEALEFGVSEAEDGLEVKPPAFRRGDITREADVIEEVARLGGLDQLPATLPSRHGAIGRLTPRQKLRRRAADILAAQGLHEIVGWSFNGPELRDKLRLGPEQPEVELHNPMSAEQSRMRRTLLGSLLDVAARNHAQGASELRLFETGAVFLPVAGEPLPREPYQVGGLLYGPARPASWREPEPPRADFFAVKGVVEALLAGLGSTFTLERAGDLFLHPGRAAVIAIDGRSVGWVGEVHPLVAGRWDLEDTVAAFELDLDAVPEPRTPGYRDVTSFPAILEDLAVVVPDTVTAAQVRETILAAGAPLLRDAQVFDVYRDSERLGAGNVSLALRLVFQAGDRTLTDEEVAERRAQIAQALERELEGRIRAS